MSHHLMGQGLESGIAEGGCVGQVVLTRFTIHSKTVLWLAMRRL